MKNEFFVEKQQNNAKKEYIVRQLYAYPELAPPT